MKLVPPTDHKFAALHGAVWSGGSFVYVPKGVHVEIPLQSYFRLNARGAGQFEHTLIIVDEGADLHFIEGCSAPKYNVANLHAGCVELYVKQERASALLDHRKLVQEHVQPEHQAGAGGGRRRRWNGFPARSVPTCFLPVSHHQSSRATTPCEFTGITFAGAGQNLDTGAKMIHVGEHTSSSSTRNRFPRAAASALTAAASRSAEMPTGQRHPCPVRL
jgi:Fe-S cluster assembly protein SufB